MICKNCGYEMPLGAEYCTCCGQYIDDAKNNKKDNFVEKVVIVLVLLVILFFSLYSSFKKSPEGAIYYAITAAHDYNLEQWNKYVDMDRISNHIADKIIESISNHPSIRNSIYYNYVHEGLNSHKETYKESFKKYFYSQLKARNYRLNQISKINVLYFVLTKKNYLVKMRLAKKEKNLVEYKIYMKPFIDLRMRLEKGKDYWRVVYFYDELFAEQMTAENFKYLTNGYLNRNRI